jgi:hypothetical protein
VLAGDDQAAAAGVLFTMLVTCQVQRSTGERVDVYTGSVQVTADDLDLTTAGDEVAKRSAFWTTLTMSAVIASAGVLPDSTAPVIGADHEPGCAHRVFFALVANEHFNVQVPRAGAVTTGGASITTGEVGGCLGDDGPLPPPARPSRRVRGQCQGRRRSRDDAAAGAAMRNAEVDRGGDRHRVCLVGKRDRDPGADQLRERAERTPGPASHTSWPSRVRATAVTATFTNTLNRHSRTVASIHEQPPSRSPTNLKGANRHESSSHVRGRTRC